MRVPLKPIESLQYAFGETDEDWVQVGENKVYQIGRIPIHRGDIVLRFLTQWNSGDCERNGIRLNPGTNGTITLSDGLKSEGRPLYIWHEPDLSDEARYPVVCPSGELVVSNIYRIRHDSGLVTEDRWTGNAGMVLLEEKSGYRRYGCSDGIGPFDPTNFEFEIEWQEKI